MPLTWTVETTRVQPATFDVVRGETLELGATFNSGGRPLPVEGWPFAIYWQTNGMGSSWWSAPATAASNRVTAAFTPAMDPGASTVVGFLGSTGRIYRAAFTLRFRHGPGAVPNALPLPVRVIDFATVEVRNPPWEGRASARPLPKYLHALDFDDSYPAEAAAWYEEQQAYYNKEGCSAVRDGGFLYRNYDWRFDDAAEFVVRMGGTRFGVGTDAQKRVPPGVGTDAQERVPPGTGTDAQEAVPPGVGTDAQERVPPGASGVRYASVGVANVGTNLTEQIVTSGKWSRYYKCLPGHTVDGINENGVACCINVVDGEPAWHTDATANALHPLGAVRWILDNATNAQHAAEYIASHIRFPQGWTQNFHYMVADEEKTYIVENGVARDSGGSVEHTTMTNFSLLDPKEIAPGFERWDYLLTHRSSITNAWFTNAYRRETNPPWVSDLGYDQTLYEAATNLWARKPKEQHRGESLFGQSWWQTVHTSVYDLTHRVLRIAVQETDDWYVFAVPSSGGGGGDAYTKAETDEKLAGKADAVDLDEVRGTAEVAMGAAQAAQGTADGAMGAATEALAASAAAYERAGAAQYTADAALPSSHPSAGVYGAWGYDSYSGHYGLSVYGTGDSRVWLTPHDVAWDSGGSYSTRISLTGLSDEISYVQGDYYYVSSELWNHIYNYSGSNPHGVTAWDVGAPTVGEVEWMISNITPESIGAAALSDIEGAIDAGKTHFRDQVLAVGMQIDPTAAAEINRILDRGSFESNCTVVVTRVLQTSEDVHRVLVESAKLYWDPGLQVTWQIDVTNGCFYSHIVSDENLVERIR